jgi:hypothetical protein
VVDLLESTALILTPADRLPGKNLSGCCRRRAQPESACRCRAVQARLALLQTVKAATALAHLNVGDVVRLDDKVRPRYLCGAHGTVVAADERDTMILLERISPAA